MINKIKKHLVPIAYILFAGIAFSWISYFVSFRLLGLIEDTAIAPLGAFLAVFSPVIGPAIGAVLFFRITKNVMISVDLWKYTIYYSVVLIMILEVYLWLYDSLWSGLGVIVAGVGGIVLSFIAYRHSK